MFPQPPPLEAEFPAAVSGDVSLVFLPNGWGILGEQILKEETMPIKVTTYNGFHLGGAALEVPTSHRFLSCLTIVKIGESLDNPKVLTSLSHDRDGLFTTEAEAIDAAIALGEEVINGEIRP